MTTAKRNGNGRKNDSNGRGAEGVSADRLSEIFSEVATQDFGYRRASVSVEPFRDFRVTWSRDGSRSGSGRNWVEFSVSDYIAGMPEDVAYGMARTICAKIIDRSGTYPDCVCEHLGSEEFVRRNQPMYLKRAGVRGRGAERDLYASVRRLEKQGLCTHDPVLRMGWRDDIGRSVGHSSALMHVCTLNPRLDSSDVPTDVLDYAVWSQVAHVGMGFNPSGARRGAEYDELLSLHPARADAESYLKKHRLML